MKYESDERAIARAVQRAQDRDEIIDHGTARAIAAKFDLGNRGPGARFATTGEITDRRPGDPGYNPYLEQQRGSTSAPESAVWGDLTYGQGETTRPLAALGDYIVARYVNGDFGPVEGWSEMGVVRHADYPHEGDGDLYDCPACEAIMEEDV